MNYVKPVVVLTTNAARVIQGSTVKPPSIYLDANGRDFDASQTAYEADE